MVHGRVLMVDQEKCDGCLLCVAACSVAHTGVVDLERAHITVYRAHEDVFVPLPCHQCETPSCVQACPTKACHRDAETRRVVIDDSRCIGCKACVVACPFGRAHYDLVSGVSTKCDYCGGEPECVKLCEPRALTYVYSDESSQGKKRASPLVRASMRRR
ncbi:MAG: 4Fe-4S dicluster domain-containing protein [Thermoleophilia bacterium]